MKWFTMRVTTDAKVKKKPENSRAL